MRQILLDTHLLLWSQFEPEKLSKTLHTLFTSDEVCWNVSQISLLEIQIKYDQGKLVLPEPPQAIFPDLLEEAGFRFQALENKAIFMLGKLPKIHRDPFDRLMIASALVNGWEIATVDHIFDRYPVQTVS